MDTDKEILEIRFHGGGVNPHAVRASEIAELISSFEKTIISTLHENNPDIDLKDYAYLSFSEIKNESIGLRFFADRATEAFLAAYFLVTTSISENDFSNLPFPAIENLKVIANFSKRHDCNCDYIYKDENIAQITPKSKIEISDNYTIKGETIIYGKIERVGGAEPRIVFKDHSDNKIYFEVTEDVAKQLASKLYEEIALTGTATWNKKTYKVLDFKVNEITDLNKKSLTETFDEIQDIIGNYWEEFDDIETYTV